MPLCQDCQARFLPPPLLRCTGCGLPLAAGGPRCGACLRRPPLWRQAHVWVDYGYPWADVIARWKLQSHPALARPFAQWLGSSPAIVQAVQAADAVLPLPLSAQRLRERGFNQAAQLAQLLLAAAPSGEPVYLPHTLQRHHQAHSQRMLTRAQRLKNLHNAFYIPQPAPLQGKQVLLVDDVMTTGATLRAASQTLLQAGAASVDVLVIARTPSEGVSFNSVEPAVR